MNYCIKYWKNRNKKFYDLDEQKRTIINWQRNERSKALNREYPQVNKYIERNEINVMNSVTEYI